MAMKRGPIMQQGSKFDPGSAISSDEDLAPRASAAQIASRKFANPKRRLGGSRSVSPSKGPTGVVDSLGNPFAPVTQNTINGMNNQAPGGSLFGQPQQQQSATPFGSSMFASSTSSSFPTGGNSNQNSFAFGVQSSFSSSSFPPSQQQSSTGSTSNSASGPFGGFTFTGSSNGLSNPFANAKSSNHDNQTPSKPSFSGSIFNIQPTNNPYSPYTFGNQTDPTRKEIKDSVNARNSNAFGLNSFNASPNGPPAVSPQKTGGQPKEFGSPSDSMQISPPVTPGHSAAAKESSLFDRISQPPSANLLGKIESATQQPAAAAAAAAATNASPASSKLFSLSNGQTAATPSSSTPSTQNFFASLKAADQSNPFASIPKSTQTPAASSTSHKPASNLFAPSSTTASSPFKFGQTTPAANIFGQAAASTDKKSSLSPSNDATDKSSVVQEKPDAPNITGSNTVNIFAQSAKQSGFTTAPSSADTNANVTSSSAGKPTTSSLFGQSTSNIFQPAAASSSGTASAPSNPFASIKTKRAASSTDNGLTAKAPTAKESSASSATLATPSVAQSQPQPQQPDTPAPSVLPTTEKSFNPTEKSQTASQARLRSLNASFLHALMNMDRGADWAPLAKAYLSEQVKIASASHSPTSSGKSTQLSRKRKDAPMNDPAESNAKKSRTLATAENKPASSSAPSSAQSSTSNLFQNILGSSSQKTALGSGPSTPQPASTFKPAESVVAPKTAPPRTIAPLANSQRLRPSETDEDSSDRPSKAPKFNPFASLPRPKSPTKPSSLPEPKTTTTAAASGSASTPASTTQPNTSFSSTNGAASTAAPALQTEFTPFSGASASSQSKTTTTSSNAGFKPIASFGSANASSSSGATTGGFTPTFGSSSTSVPSSSGAVKGGFTPTFGSTTNASSSVGAAKGGFTPTFGAGAGSSVTSGDFMSQFAQAAAKTAAKEKKRRRDEDFDSDEETEAEWEARDAEKQRKMREEAQKSSQGMIARFVPGEGFVMERSDDSRDNSEAETVKKTTPSSSKPLGAPSKSPAMSTTPDQAPKANAFTAFAANIRTSASPSVPSGSLQVPSSSNIFAHLSDGNSSAHGDDEDSESDDSGFGGGAEQQKSLTPTRRKRKSDDAKDVSLDSEQDTLENAMQKSPKRSRSSYKSPSTAMNAAESSPSSSANLGNSLFGHVSPARISQSSAGATSRSNNAASQVVNSTPLSLDGSNSPSVSAAASPATGDHTWKPTTPIKFGQTPGNPTVNITSPSPEKPKTNGGTPSASSNSLFGSTASPASSGSLFWNLSKPADTSVSKPSSTGFSFGAASGLKPSTSAAGTSFGAAATPTSNAFSFLSAAANTNSALSSRAASPGSTAASGSEAVADEDGAAEPKLAQVDLTSLTEQERKDYEVLFEVARAKCMRSVQKDDKTIWDTKGTGPVRVLKNKETGTVHMQGRAAPSGKIFLNSVLSAQFDYTHAGKGMAQIWLLNDEGKPERNIIRMNIDEDVKNFVKVLEDNKPKPHN